MGKVLNDRRREINLEGSNFTVSANGTIFEDGDEAGKLYIAVFEEDSEVIRTGQDTYISSSGYDEADEESYRVIQGALEKSNVNIAKEMSRIIAGQNHFQSCAQILKIYDRINELSVNRIGSIE